MIPQQKDGNPPPESEYLLLFQRVISASEVRWAKLAERTGLEPATPGVTGRYSNQLNYRSELRDRFEDGRLCSPFSPR